MVNISFWWVLSWTLEFFGLRGRDPDANIVDEALAPDRQSLLLNGLMRLIEFYIMKLLILCSVSLGEYCVRCREITYQLLCEPRL